MISVGIDISKGKSMICMLKPYGEVVKEAYEIQHSEGELKKLVEDILSFEEEVKVVMEATGIYHLPVLAVLKEHNIFVSVINPLIMKKYSVMGLRKVKTDKMDAIKIANYGIDQWFKLVNYEVSDSVYSELKILGRQYSHYITMRIASKVSLSNLLDRTMPGIKTLLNNRPDKPEMDKLNDFVREYWHYDNITKKSEKQFINSYLKWTKKKGYRPSETKAKQIYALAQESIPTLPSNTASTKMLVLEAVRVLSEIDKTLHIILTQMQELARTLKEFDVVRDMPGVGDTLAPRLIAEIGDIKRFHNKKALIAYAGIDSPPFESGQFVANKRRISKRGSALLRKTGYEIMKCIKSIKPDDPIYLYMLKKEAEGKPKKVAKIAALNKFLRIYFAKVREVYLE